VSDDGIDFGQSERSERRFPEMAWTLPQYSKTKVSWAGERIIAPYPEGAIFGSEKYGRYWEE
jgi:hypothetical protein